LQRHGISQLPKVAEDKLAQKKFKLYPTRYVHIDTAQMSTAARKLYLFIAIEHASQFLYAALHQHDHRSIPA
jgi:hypothetical protein